MSCRPKYTVEQLKEKASNIHKNIYEYSLWNGINTMSHIIPIICKEHGVFNQRLNEHINKLRGCPKCGIAKRKQTLISNHGHPYVPQTKSTRHKIQKTNNKRYGGNAPACSPDIQLKIQKTHTERHGCAFSAQQHISDQTLSLLQDKSWLIDQHISKQKPLYGIFNELDDIHSSTTICNYVKKHGIDIQHYRTSIGEKELRDFISVVYQGPTVYNSRKVVAPYELDIWLPELNIAIEFNGDYWHGDHFPKHKQRDLIKKTKCNELNINLIVVMESDWIDNRECINNTLISQISGN